MPHIKGETLRDRIDREHQLPLDDAVRIATNVAGALDYAHRRGVVHRDIKPANILLQDGKPVVSDFGIAPAVGAAGAGRLTETGLSLGSPRYMSPEQATGDQTVGPATEERASVPSRTYKSPDHVRRGGEWARRSPSCKRKTETVLRYP